MWQPESFDQMGAAFTQMLLNEVLRLIAWLFLVSAGVALIIYLLGVVKLCLDEERAARARRRARAPRPQPAPAPVKLRTGNFATQQPRARVLRLRQLPDTRVVAERKFKGR